MSIFWKFNHDRVSGTAASIAGIVLILLFNRSATSQDEFDQLFGNEDNPPAEEAFDAAPEEEENEDVLDFPTEEFRFRPPNYPTAFIIEEADDAYREGHALAVQGKYEDAIQFFNNAIALDPKFVDALYERGLAFAALGEADPAIQSLIGAADVNSDPQSAVELNTTLGQQFMETKRYEEAAAAFGRAREIDYIDLDLRLLEGSALIRYGLEVQATRPALAQDLLAYGVDIFDEVLDEENAEAEFFFLRGSAHYQLGDIEDALDDMKEAELLRPTEWKYLQRIGFIELQQGHLEAAKETESNNELIMEHYRASILAFDRYLVANPGDPKLDDPDEDELGDLFLPIDIYLGRAVAKISMARHLPKGDFFQESLIGAIADCNTAILFDEERSSAYFNRGTAERLLETYDAAIVSFTESIRLDPGNSEAHLLRGIVWFYLDESDLALGDFETDSGPGADPRFHFWSGLVHAKKGDFYEAVKAYSNVLRTNPDHHMARINRGLAYLQIDEGEKAIDEFNQLILLDPLNAQAFYYRGLAYELSMLDEAAIGSYRRALSMDPLLEDAQLRLEGLDAQ